LGLEESMNNKTSLGPKAHISNMKWKAYGNFLKNKIHGFQSAPTCKGRGRVGKNGKMHQHGFSDNF